MPKMEEYVSSTVQKSKFANMKDVVIVPSREEYVSSMEQRRNVAAMKDATTKLSREVSV